jgi:D-alanyl-D-alanine carboxypeptidase
MMEARVKAIALTLLALLCAATARADETRTNLAPDLSREIDAVVAAHIAEYRLPSLAIGIWMPGSGFYLSARGDANLETHEPRRLDQPFRIGSITKTMYGTVILQLADEGRLSVTDPIAKWFPGFPNAERITIDDLLRMRSGIPDSWTQELLQKYFAEPMMAVTAEDMIERAAKDVADFKPPGRATIYTNVNFVMLGHIMEVAGGAPAETQLRERVFKPLGMNATLVPSGPELPGGLRGYGWNAEVKKYDDKTELNPGPVGGAGAAISSIGDLYSFASALCTGRLLQPHTQAARMQSEPFAGTEADPGKPGPAFVRYGEAVGLLSRFCGHNGTIMGFSTEMFYLPSTGATFVINAARLDADDTSMSSGLFVKLAKLLFPGDVDW